MTSPNTPDFNQKAAPPTQLDAKSYQAILESLVANGDGWGKTKNVGAYFLSALDFETKTSSGKVETRNTVEFAKKMYIVMDVDQYPSEYLRNLVIQDITKKWGGKLIKERDLTAPEFSGPGLWLLKKDNFEGDYKPLDAKSNTYAPDPTAWRVMLGADKAVKIPVVWAGGFTIEAGGHLAVRQKDIPALAQALADIKAGKTTAEEALYVTDEKSGERIAKFDIYGTEPKFQDNNSAPIVLNDVTTAIQAGFKAKPASAAKPAVKTP